MTAPITIVTKQVNTLFLSVKSKLSMQSGQAAEVNRNSARKKKEIVSKYVFIII